MNEEQKHQYHEKYLQEKQKSGLKFWPDIIFKDLLVSFALFLLIVGLATFVGVAAEPKADPTDSSYVPRPEWYFMFLFQMLKYFPGQVEFVGTTIIPGLLVTALLLLPFYDRNPFRHFSKRKFAISFMTGIVIGMVTLTIVAFVTTPEGEESVFVQGGLVEQITTGQDLYSEQCTECHGADGDTTIITGTGNTELDGTFASPISSKDVMLTRNDTTLANIISRGQPELGMPAFLKGYGGELSASQVDAIVTFMRYTWGGVELPPEALAAMTIPLPAEGQTPSYEEHIAPIVDRYCASCHRAGKKNNNYLMGSYDEVLNTGDHKPNLIPGDLNSNLLLMLHLPKDGSIEAGGAMPPTKPLADKFIDVFTRWVQAGMPNTAADAAAISVPAPAGATPSPAGTETTPDSVSPPAGAATPIPSTPASPGKTAYPPP